MMEEHVLLLNEYVDLAVAVICLSNAGPAACSCVA